MDLSDEELVRIARDKMEEELKQQKTSIVESRTSELVREEVVEIGETEEVIGEETRGD